MYQRNAFSGVLLVLAAGVLWGTVGPAQVLAGSPASPITLGAARILTGGLLLTAVVLVTAPRAFGALSRPSRSVWAPLLAASAATGTFQAAFLTSVDRVGAAVATAVVFGLAPVTSGLFERLVLRTRLTRRWLGGTACAIAGCALLMLPGPGGPGPGTAADPFGIALGVLAGCCFGVYTVSAKLLLDHEVGMAAAVAVTLLIGGSLLLPWALPDVPELAGARSLALVAWLGPATTAVAYMCFVTGLRRVTAATAGTLSLVEPLVAAVLALAVLGERLSAAATAGAALLLGGLVLVSVPLPRRPPRPRRPARGKRPCPCGDATPHTARKNRPGRLSRLRRRSAPGTGQVCWRDATGAVKVESTTGERS